MASYIIYIGSHTLDFVVLQGRLVDYEEGGMQGLRTDMPGFQPMTLSLVEAMPLHGAAAGIVPADYDHFVMCNETVDMIDECLAIAVKQVEVLKESRAHHVDARQNDIGLMVDSMRSRAQRRKDPSILIPFEKVLKYYSQIAEKALATRKRNLEAQAEEEEGAELKADAEPPLTEPAPLAAPAPIQRA